MSADKTEKKDDSAKAKGEGKRLGWNDPRLLAGAVVVLIALSIYNTIALHLVRSTTPAESETSAEPSPGESDQANAADAAADPDVDVDASATTGATGDMAVASRPSRSGSREGGAETASRDETDATSDPSSGETRDDAELERLYLQAEQSLSERERVLNYIFYANSFREVHRERLAAEAERKAAGGMDAGTLARDLLQTGDRLRKQGDFDAAREAYYLRLCRSARLPNGQAATTYFRIADLYYREAMKAPLEEGGGL